MVVAEVVPVLNKIHETGYWRVVIRPIVFDAQQLPNLTACREIMKSSQVRLREWEYPVYDDSVVSSGQDWIQAEVESPGHREFWRFYQSGQFVQHLACWEDLLQTQHKFLSFLRTLFTFTEIFEFASRLAEKDLLRPGGEIAVTLFDMQGRTIREPENNLRGRGPERTAQIDPIIFSQTCSQEELMGSQNSLALDATIFVLERFNWIDPSRDMLAEDQRRLLERRL